jgi:hypothetical protein
MICLFCLAWAGSVLDASPALDRQEHGHDIANFEPWLEASNATPWNPKSPMCMRAGGAMIQYRKQSRSRLLGCEADSGRIQSDETPNKSKDGSRAGRVSLPSLLQTSLRLHLRYFGILLFF